MLLTSKLAAVLTFTQPTYTIKKEKKSTTQIPEEVQVTVYNLLILKEVSKLCLITH